MQNGICLVSSQDELICEERGRHERSPVIELHVQYANFGKSHLTEILHDPFVHEAFQVNHADRFLWIK